jgi:glycosyltransferase involved in cell wall biosynthesis
VKEKADRRRLRVALAITELNVGGAERCLTHLALGLDRERFEPIVVSLGARPEPTHASLVEQLEKANVPLHFLNLRSSRQIFQGWTQLRRFLQQQAPDVVQTFLFHANVLGVTAAAQAGVPGIAAGVRVADPRRGRLWLERMATSRAARIVCVSQGVAEFVVRRGRFPQEKIVVIPNGIDASLYIHVVPIPVEQLGVPNGRRIMVAMGRLDKQKGLDWLLSFASPLLAQTPQHDLVIVGDGPQRRELMNVADQAGVGSRVHFPGWRSDIPSILAASDLLLLPSRWEGMPNVVLEAMASGLPVVATQSEGVCELLSEAAEPQTVALGDSQAFTAKVVSIARDREMAAALGQKNRVIAEKNFSLATMVASYSRLFEALVQPEKV